MINFTDCNMALERIVPLIDFEKIDNIIEEIEEISDIRKEFYKKILRVRYEKILKYSYDRLKGC